MQLAVTFHIAVALNLLSIHGQVLCALQFVKACFEKITSDERHDCYAKRCLLVLICCTSSDVPCRSPNDIPKQLNGCDCGVFALMFAEYQSRDAPFTFDQRHMEYFRVKVVADIMSLKVDSPGQIV